MPRKQRNWVEDAEEQATAEEQAGEEVEVIPTVGALLEQLMALHASDAPFVGRYKRNGVWYDISIRRRNA